MKIWILNHYAVSPDSIGGTRHYDFAKELVKQGHEVKIFASSFNHFERRETVEYDSIFYKEISYGRVEYVWIKTPSYTNSLMRVLNIITFSFRLNKVLNNFFKKEIPDLIIGSSVHPLTPLIGLKNAKKLNIKFYFEERDLWPQTFIDFGILSKKNIITRVLFKLEKYLYKHSDRVIFLFEKADKYAINKGLHPMKPLYIPNGFSNERIMNVEKSYMIENIIKGLEQKKLCIYIGSMGEANHMQPLLNLANLMKYEKDYHFIFVGKGDKKESLIHYKNENKLQNVSFFEPIPKKEIPLLLKHAYCGLISMKDSPLYKWGFSMNKIYDYLSMGLPILMYSNLMEMGKLEETTAIFKADSEEKLKEYLLSHMDINQNELKKFTYENYSWEILTEKFLESINTVDNNKL